MDKRACRCHCSENQSFPDFEPGETIMCTGAARVEVPNDLEAFWLPFTPNRAFKKAPRLISRSKDMHYYTPEGREILDATAALWCCNAGHNRPHIVGAIQRQPGELDFSPTFQFAHPQVFALA